MRVLPAVDLRDGACVQLVGGDFAQEKVRLPNPLDVADRFVSAGFSALHVVDLNAAMGQGENRKTVEALCQKPGLRVQVGGGVRDVQAVESLLSVQAFRIVVGTRAIEEPAWLERLAVSFPHRLVLAADVRNRMVVTRGWQKDAGLDVFSLLRRVQHLPLAAVLVTAVHVEGQLSGTDVPLFQEVVVQAAFPVIASGGITTVEDLRALEGVGVAETVVGMALYTGRLDTASVAKEFGK